MGFVGKGLKPRHIIFLSQSHSESCFLGIVDFFPCVVTLQVRLFVYSVTLVDSKNSNSGLCLLQDLGSEVHVGGGSALLSTVLHLEHTRSRFAGLS